MKARKGISMEKLDKLDLTIPTTEQKPKHKFIPSVQKKDLIDEGINLERFMRDDDITVRHYLMDNHPEFIPEMVAMSSDNYAIACHIVETRKDITAHILESLIDNNHHYHNIIQDDHKKLINSFIIKRNAMQQEPSLLERTMSLRKLYETQSPLWARPYSPKQIQTITEIHAKTKKNDNEEDFLNQFEIIFVPENTSRKMENDWRDHNWSRFITVLQSVKK